MTYNWARVNFESRIAHTLSGYLSMFIVNMRVIFHEDMHFILFPLANGKYDSLAHVCCLAMNQWYVLYINHVPTINTKFKY